MPTRLSSWLTAGLSCEPCGSHGVAQAREQLVVEPAVVARAHDDDGVAGGGALGQVVDGGGDGGDEPGGHVVRAQVGGQALDVEALVVGDLLGGEQRGQHDLVGDGQGVDEVLSGRRRGGWWPSAARTR